MNTKDGRLVARENEVRVLRALHRFGWLRTRDFAALAWTRWQRKPANEPTLIKPVASASGLRMAQRTLRRMADTRQVLRGKAPDGSVVYALAEAGARRLQQLGLQAATGKDLIRSFSTAQFRHRTTANEIAIGAILAGFRASTEREIAQGRSFCGTDGIEGKKPDALLTADQRVWWVEVERSRKNSKDYAKLLTWLSLARQDSARPVSTLLPNGLRWAKVVFVCTDAFKNTLTRDLIAQGWNKSNIDVLLLFETSLYSFKDMLFI